MSLDDIAKRNREQVPYDPLVKLVDRIGGDGKPSDPVKPFTLPSQRKSTTQVWKVLLLMLLIGAVVGLYTCRQMDRVQDDDRAHGR